MPLITYPYLIRTLGKETYGLIIFAQAIISYLVIIVGFGFNISATKEVSLNRDNKEKLSEILSNVMTIKGVLFILSLMILSMLVFLFPQFKTHKTLYFLSMYMCLYEFIFPIWFFQGIEKMKYITILNLISRFSFLCLIFLFIKSQDDYLLVPIFNGIGALIAGIIGLFIVFNQYKLKFKRVYIKTLKKYFKNSFAFFTSRMSEVIIERSGIVIIGAMLSLTEVAYYDLALKITKTLTLPFNILVNTIYPDVVKKKNKSFIINVLKYAGVASFIVYLGVLIGGKEIIQLLGGSDMLPTKHILNILSLSISLSTITYILGDTILVPWGYSNWFNLSTIFRMLLFLFFIMILFLTKNITGYNIALLISLSLVFDIFFRSIIIKRYNILNK